MADSFSRDGLSQYEKKPQTQISDKAMVANFMKDATPAQAASAAAVAAVAAGQIDATPGGAPARAVAAPDPLVDDSPVVDEDGTLGDPTVSGEGTSDAPSEESSASAVDPGNEPDPNTDLTGEEPEVAAQPAPKKGSAAERIVEVLDLADGYKEYGKLKAAEAADLRAELERLKTPVKASPAVASLGDKPMPRMEDEDVNFDADKLQAKTEKWIDARAESAADRAFERRTGQTEHQKMLAAIDTKMETFAKDHPDFETVVKKNRVLFANQLAAPAAGMVGRSEYTAEIVYRFGKDLKEGGDLAVRAAKADPVQQMLIVADMIADIKAEKKAAGKPMGKSPQSGAQPGVTKSITRAPPPPQPTRAGGRAVARDTLDPSMSMDDFAREHRGRTQAARAQNRKLRGLD
jgi:hypothetical protein